MGKGTELILGGEFSPLFYCPHDGQDCVGYEGRGTARNGFLVVLRLGMIMKADRFVVVRCFLLHLLLFGPILARMGWSGTGRNQKAENRYWKGAFSCWEDCAFDQLSVAGRNSDQWNSDLNVERGGDVDVCGLRAKVDREKCIQNLPSNKGRLKIEMQCDAKLNGGDNDCFYII